MKKDKWGKPKLIILTRGKPEERVLEVCKADGDRINPAASFNFCFGYEAECIPTCSSEMAS